MELGLLHTYYELAYFATLELQEKNKEHALVTLCVVVGQGYAMVIEKV